MDSSSKSVIITFVLFGVLLATTLAIYWPGLNGIFVLDDHPNLRDLGRHLNLPVTERLFEFVFSGTSGVTGRPLSMASFLINDYAWPTDPKPFKYTNVMLHLVNGALVFWLAWLLVGVVRGLDLPQKTFVALAAAAAWLLHPFNISAVLYVVQRMAELAALFTLLGLVVYVKGRLLSVTRPGAGFSLMSAGIIFGGGLGVLCKENAVLLPVYVAVVEYTLLRPYGLPQPPRWRPWAMLFLAGPILTLVGWHVWNFSRIASGYAFRPFTLVERLLTQSRILWDYAANILVPRRYGTGLFHDDFAVSRSLTDPWTTALALGGLIAVVALAWAARGRWPLVAFAVFWFLGGHALESGIWPLELYFEHRNYLPMFGPLLALMYGLTRIPASLRKLGYVAAVLLVGLSALTTWQNSTLWGKPVLMAEVWAEEHLRSPRAQQFSADMWSRIGNYSKAKARLEGLLAANPKHASAYVQLIQMDCLLGKSIDRTQYRRVLEGLNQGSADPAVHVTIEWLARRVHENQCADLSYAHIDELIDTVLSNRSFTDRRSMAAHLYKVSADSFIARKNFAAATKALQNAMKYAHSVDLALMQAGVFLAVGDYDAALHMVEKARSWDRSPLFKLKRRQRDIASWQMYIIEQKQRGSDRDH
ncbi:MAG: hypothetical protein OES09_04125 [Gammaproteobacteria bacterium]|nr:hypothetical protein [Gammaproteobacteria bacterium]